MYDVSNLGGGGVNANSRATYSVQDTLRVQVLKSGKNLLGKILGHIMFKATIFAQATSYGATGNIFQETSQNQGRIFEREASSHAQEIGCFLKPKVLNDIRMV